MSPAAANLGAQQQRFDQFRRLYNDERPNEGLRGDCPAEHYQPSSRRFPERLPELEYPAGFHLRRADQDGKIRWKQARCRVGGALGHEVIGVEAVDDGVWRVWFGPVLLGLLDERKGYTNTDRKECASWPPLQSPSGLLGPQPTHPDAQEEDDEL